MCSPDPTMNRQPGHAPQGIASVTKEFARLHRRLVALGLTASLALFVPVARADADTVLSRTEAIRALTEEQASRGPAEETTHTLRWKESASDKNPGRDDVAWRRFFEWLGRAIEWIAEGGRWVVWLLGAIAFAVLVVGLRRWLQVKSAPLEPGPGPVPTHVGSLDVRPESLPADLAAAAQQLWDQGQTRASLSLLYRGALSRLIHLHGVPIRAGHTEGECLRLAGARLGAPARAYFASLVGTWERLVYAGQGPDTQQISSLVLDFDARMGPEPVSIIGDAA